jgi:hypothetical protein
MEYGELCFSDQVKAMMTQYRQLKSQYGEVYNHTLVVRRKTSDRDGGLDMDWEYVFNPLWARVIATDCNEA